MKIIPTDTNIYLYNYIIIYNYLMVINNTISNINQVYLFNNININIKFPNRSRFLGKILFANKIHTFLTVKNTYNI